MKKRIFKAMWLSVMAVAVVTVSSCSSDSDFNWDSDFHDWQSELSHIVMEYNALFENSGIKLCDYKIIKNAEVEAKDFIGDSQLSFPVYYKENWGRINPVSYSFLMQDTLTTHMPLHIIQQSVEDVVENQSDYDFVQLQWSCDDILYFTTIAAFDKTNGELVYDNLLYNILNKSKLRNRTAALTKSEIVDVDFATELYNQIEYSASYAGVSKSIRLNVYYHWKRQYDMSGPYPTYTDRCLFDNVTTDVQESGSASGVVKRSNFECFSFPGSQFLTYSIYIWVGKSSLLDNYSLSFSSVAGFRDYCLNNGIYNIEADCRYDIGVHEPLDSFIAF